MEKLQKRWGGKNDGPACHGIPPAVLPAPAAGPFYADPPLRHTFAKGAIGPYPRYPEGHGHRDGPADEAAAEGKGPRPDEHHGPLPVLRDGHHAPGTAVRAGRPADRGTDRETYPLFEDG